MERSSMRDIKNLYFSPFAKKVLTLYSQNMSETAFFTVMSEGNAKTFFLAAFDLESATDK